MYDKYVSAAFIFSVPILIYGVSAHLWTVIATGLAVQGLGWLRYIAIKRRPPA